MVYAVIVPKSTEGFDTEKGVSCPPARAVHPAKDLVGGQVRTLKCPEFELLSTSSNPMFRVMIPDSEDYAFVLHICEKGVARGNKEGFLARWV